VIYDIFMAMHNHDDSNHSVPSETIATFSTPTEAHVLRARLEEEGIPAMVADEHLVNAHSLLTIAVGGVKVKIPPEYVAQATKVLQAIDAGEYALEDPDAKPVAPLPALDEALLAYTHDPSYLEKWRGLIGKTDSLAGFNFYAAVFGMPWFFLRKMYRLGVIVYLADLAAIFIGPVILSAVAAPPGADNRTLLLYAMLSVAVLVRIPVGIMANVFYYRKAASAVQDATVAIPSRKELLQALKSRGGINFGAAMLGVVAIVLIRFLIENINR
jgi:hypothetical protein